MAGLNFKGMDLVSPVNRIRAGMAAIAQNVRAYVLGGLQFRNLLSDAILTLTEVAHTIRRLNDSTPNGPAGGYSLIIGNGSKISVWNPTLGVVDVATGMSGNPVSIIPFRPNASVQPWAYIADSAPQGDVTITTKFLISGAATTFVTNGMLKVRSDGLCYKMGIKEPQLAPIVSTSDIVTTGTDSLPATTIPWTNVGGANTTNYGYGQTNAADGTQPVIITGGGPSLVPGSTITLVVTGSATVNGATHAPGDAGPTSSGHPGAFIAGAQIVVGAFTDASGNVLPPAGSLPLVFTIGAGTTVTVPANAVQLQIGIDSAGNTFSANSGAYSIAWSVTINPISTVVSTVGDVTAYVWGTPPPAGGGSPHSGPVASYIWKNPSDGGSGTPRSITDPVPDASPTNNSWIFDSTPEDGTVPVNWDTLNPDGSVLTTIPLFDPALESQGYQDFNCCIVGSLFVPAAGTHTLTFQYKDQIMVGIGGGGVATFSSGTAGASSSPNGTSGQTVSVVNKLPLIFTSAGDGSGSHHTTTYSVAFPGTGVYDIEIDWDYWEHTGRSFIMTCDGVVIPPISANIRQEVQYRYVYRSSATGALSNPSPESTAQALPVVANGVTSYWSDDPQVDVVDYYRIDSTTSDFTYVATGPNDNLGAGGTNTSIVDLLTDTELGNQLLELDNFEPFPSIDLPQKGTVNISGGVITWLTGGAIGGTATGFNLRWLAGTDILIGSPTSLAYVLIARPTSTTTMTIPGVPDGTNLAYEIPEPILANQPMAYMAGPTDNINFVLANGDPLRPGTSYWCKGSNLDSAPDTNQEDVTDPGEPLVNVAMSSGRGVQFSIKRAWVIMPNFFNAQASAAGTSGSTWTFQATEINRGLYMPRCLAVEGSGLIFFRVDDGIHVSPNGAASKSITDDSLYPLFPHENADSSISVPQPVTREGVTVYPPDDSQPQLQKFSIQNAYLYYDYVDTTNVPRTLVFDIAAMGWVWDVYATPATIHASNEGLSSQGTLVGCNDNSIRQMASGGTEAGTSILLSPSIGGTGWNHAREVIVEYISTAQITMTGFAADSGNGSYGPAPITLPSTGGTLAKLKISTGPTPNKWKLMWFQFTSTTQFTVNLEGFVVYTRPWGSNSAYIPTRPFADSGGEG